MADPSVNARINSVVPALLEWYDHHARSLPWRVKSGQLADPYRVWLSEIMLQQTTVAAVKPYFRKFISRWPTIKALANSSLEDVLAAWAGLGYYSRARNLHACARRVMEDYGGRFPATETELIRLPGIGPYTAAAIAAIAFGASATVVDGNVERVISRLFACRDPLPGVKPELRRLAATLTPKARAGDYAQAMMDLGATICTPRTPSCATCPIAQPCAARRLDIASILPARIERVPRPIRRAIAFWLVNATGDVWIRRRPPRGLLGGMLEIPSSPWLAQEAPCLDDARSLAPIAADWKLTGLRATHVFTHFALELDIAVARLAPKVRMAPDSGFWTKLAPQSDSYQAMPSVMRKIVDAMHSSPSLSSLALPYPRSRSAA